MTGPSTMDWSPPAVGKLVAAFTVEDLTALMDPNFGEDARLEFARIIHDREWLSDYLSSAANAISGQTEWDVFDHRFRHATCGVSHKWVREWVSLWNLYDYFAEATPQRLSAMYVLALMAVPASYCGILDVAAVASRHPQSAGHAAAFLRWYAANATGRHPSLASPVLWLVADLVSAIEGAGEFGGRDYRVMLRELCLHEWFRGACLKEEVSYDLDIAVLACFGVRT